jgi:hypothetical protein
LAKAKGAGELMSLWFGIIAASLAVYSWKIFGYLLPSSVLNNPVLARIANLLTVALLAALLGVQGFTNGTEVEIDARVPALLVAALLLLLRAPFIVMVATAALVAALIRLWFG